MPLLAASRVVSRDGLLDPGWVLVEGEVIAALGSGPPPQEYGPALDLGELTLVPGFVDIHCHGGGGHWLTSGDVDEVAGAAEFHLRHGTTSLLAGMITAPEDDLARGIAAATELVGDPSSTVEGILLEGPWISTVRCGAHDPTLIRPPDRGEWSRIRSEAVRMVTLAPELSGAPELAAAIRGDGAVVSLGHSDATYAQGAAALEAGARVATHLFNAMPPLHHRDPGLVAACLEGAVCEVIADGHHLHEAVIRMIFAAAAHRVALITDAIGLAGLPDGDYETSSLASARRIELREGAARLDGTLAGSTLTMGQAFRRTLVAGVDLRAAVHAASTAPAAVVGLSDRGAIAAGLRADLAAVDHLGTVRHVWLAGRPVECGEIVDSTG